jgi:hypothetical protein
VDDEIGADAQGRFPQYPGQMAEAATQIRRRSFRQGAFRNISEKVLDAILLGDDAEAAAVVQSAIEEFPQELAYVTRRFLKTKAWEKTGRIVVGGGFGTAASSPSHGRPSSSRPKTLQRKIARFEKLAAPLFQFFAMLFFLGTLKEIPGELVTTFADLAGCLFKNLHRAQT